MKTKRIIFINQTLGMGGAEQFGKDLLVGFQQEGIAVEAYATNLNFQKELQESEIQTKHIPVVIDIIGDWKGLLKAIFYLPFAIYQYWSIVRNLTKDDLILLSGFPEKILVSMLAQQRNISVVWIEYGPLTSVFAKFGGLPKRLYQKAITIPKAIIVPSENTKKDLVKTFPNIKSMMHVIPCGRPLPQKYKVEIVPHQIVCVSRMERGKGQDLLVTAFAKVIQKIPDARLVFVGKGDFDLEVKKIVSEQKLDSAVTFMNHVPDPRAVIAQSQIAVFPSVWELEGFGLVTIEAMSLAKPIVAFNTGPTPEIIQHNKTGILVEKGNTDKLADAIIHLFKLSQQAVELGKNARKRFEKTYIIGHIVKQYLHLFTSL